MGTPEPETRYTVWGRRSSSNTQKVLWCLAELGQAYTLVPTGGSHGGLRAPGYLALNPNGRVPTLRDQDAGLAIWESNAIVRYLAARHGGGGLWPLDEALRGRADMWMEWQQATLKDALLAVFKDAMRGAEAQPDSAVVAEARGRAIAMFGLLDAHLARHPYVAGEGFTMGDIPLGVWAERFFGIVAQAPELPHVRRWHGALRERPAYMDSVPWPLFSND